MYDSFNRRINYLRISVTDLCNLRCTYCMPAEGITLLPHDSILSFEEIHSLTHRAVDLGINKVRLTGGEPLVRRGIVDLVTMLGTIEGIDDFAMTTNAVLLPQYAHELRSAGLHRLNISLDTMDPEHFRKLTRFGELSEVLEGIDAAIDAGFDKIKLNCVVTSSATEPHAEAVAAYGRKKDLQVRFIQQMDTQAGTFGRVIGGDGGHCTSCNRLRVTSDGRIYPCLFCNQSFSIRELGIDKAIDSALKNKPEAGHKSENPFYRLGG